MQLTKEQGIILTGFTGILCCDWKDFHREVEKRLDRPVFTHEFASSKFLETVQGFFKEDFERICPMGAVE